MGDFLKSTDRRLLAALFWPLALLALSSGLLLVLSGCALQAGGIQVGPPPVFDGGPEPQTSAVMCDIPKVQQPGSTGCADSTEAGFGMSMSRAAVALVQGESSSLALDLSPAATKACGGLPQKTEFQGPFPDGYAVCLNCGTQIPVPYADGNAVCVAQCIDLANQSDVPVPGGAESFCQLNAHVSTNFDKTTCFDNACSSGGTLLANFVDPRRAQEPVKWTDLIGVCSSTGPGACTAGNPQNTLIRTTPTAVPPAFDAGAASEQLITTGDGWVEFEANENTLGHVLGLSSVPVSPNPPANGKDIGFAMILRGNGTVDIFEGGTKVATAVAMYNAGDRFRVRVTDNNDDNPHTAKITYTKLTAPCTPGTICAEVQIASQIGSSPSYPFRVDASLRDVGATLVNVTVVRIK